MATAPMTTTKEVEIVRTYETVHRTDLPESQRIDDIFAVVDHILKALNGLVDEAKMETQRIQTACPHTRQEKIWDKGYIQALKQKFCPDCKLREFPPAEANRCKRCWGKLKYMGRVSGQGGGVHIHECLDCGWEHEST